MVTFNDTLDIALQSVCMWNRKNILVAVTLVRDVCGKVSFFMDNAEPALDADDEELKTLLRHDMGGYFSGRVYWKKRSGKLKHMAERIKPLLDLVADERQAWNERDGIVFYILERPIAKKAWIMKGQQQESAWPYEEAVGENGTKVITFYSFKGGMGRTTALAGAALTLAKRGKSIVMVDTDIEAPGLATLFFEEETIDRGVLDYLLEYNLENTVRIEDYILDVAESALLSEEEGHLFLMPAGRVDNDYLQKLARIDYQDNRENYLRDSVKTLVQEIRVRYRPDYIFVDARAGFHDLGGVMVTQLPHGDVLFGNDSRQSWDGIVQVLRTVGEGHAEDFPIMIVDTMCPSPTSPEYASARDSFILKSYTACVENYYDGETGIPGPDAAGEAHYPVMIPFDYELLHGVELYSDGSQERNQKVGAYKERLTGDAYQQIVERIEGWFGG